MKYFQVTVKFEVSYLDGKGEEKSKTVTKNFLTNADSVPQADAQTKAHIGAMVGGNISYEITKVAESSLDELILTDKFNGDVSFVAEDLAEVGLK